MENCIPKFWEREWESKKAFPTFGNGNGNEKLIPKRWEWESEARIPENGREREFPLTPGCSLGLCHNMNLSVFAVGIDEFGPKFRNALSQSVQQYTPPSILSQMSSSILLTGDCYSATCRAAIHNQAHKNP